MLQPKKYIVTAFSHDKRDILWISVLRGMHCQKVSTELGHCRTERRCIVVVFDIEWVSPFFFFRQEIAVLKGRS